MAQAIAAMRTGRRYVSPGAAATLLMPPAPAAHDQLTPRQLEVLRLVAEGLSTKAIARQLELSIKELVADFSGTFPQIRRAIETQLSRRGRLRLRE